MKVTRLGPPRPILNSGLGGNAGHGVPGGGSALQVLTSDGSNGRYWGENVRRITSNGSNILLSPDVNIAAGSNVTFAIASNTLFIHGSAGGSGGLADQGSFTYLDAIEAAAPGTPASGKARIYAKSDGRIYSKDDAGVEYGPFDSGGGGDPRDFPAAWTLDDIAVGGGVLFNEAPGLPTGMTAHGTIGSGDYQSMPGLDLLLDAGDHISIPDPGGDLEVMYHFSDMFNDNGVIGVGFFDNSGNGYAATIFAGTGGLNNTVVSGYQFASFGANAAMAADYTNTFAHYWIAVKRVGTTLTARGSLTGTSFAIGPLAGVTNSTSTRIAFGRYFSGGGGKPVRVHLLVVATPDLGV